MRYPVLSTRKDKELYSEYEGDAIDVEIALLREKHDGWWYWAIVAENVRPIETLERFW